MNDRSVSSLGGPILYNPRVPQLEFFIGKGGVGKTTVSAAYALHRATLGARQRRKVLLLSTDPAHSLAGVLQTKLGSRPTPLPQRKNLFVWQLDAEKSFAGFLRPYRKPLLDLVENGTFFSRNDVEPLLDATLPGMAEVSALIALQELLDTGEYDEIVVDTAPIGHTLRLFSLPEHFRRFLDFLDLAGSRDQWLAQRFGGGRLVSQTFLAEWETMLERLDEHWRSGAARLVMVTSPEHFSLEQAERSVEALRRSGSPLRVDAVVLNRVVIRGGDCQRCRERAQVAKKAMSRLKTARLKRRQRALLIGEDAGSPPMGVAALLAFGRHVFAGAQLRLPPSRISPFRKQKTTPAARKSLGLKKTEWPRLQWPLSFTLGKGGVGKTTVSAGLGFHQRRVQRNTAVALCSTDPAPSLDEVFATDVGPRLAPVLGDQRFFAMEMDSVAEYRAWADAMQEKINGLFSRRSGGAQVDLSFERRLFSALLEIVPPGVDEIFAIFKILDLLRQKNMKIVIDMAPTGHALELLRLPDRLLQWTRLLLKSLAPHRTLPLAQELAVEVATLGQRVRGLRRILRESRRARCFVVLLAEPLPGEETARLVRSLDALDAEVGAIFVNRVLADAAGCRRCESARQWQQRMLEQVRRRYAGRTVFVIDEQPAEVIGAAALQRLTRSLWRLA